jgi:alcohol dehydrogenase
VEPIVPFDLHLRTRVVYGGGTFDRVGSLARELGFAHTLLVADAGIVRLGLADRVQHLLGEAGVRVSRFHDFGANPDTAMVDAGRQFAARAGTDSMIAVGGGSSLDCAKGINFLLTNGGTMKDYHGHGKATRPMHPMIAVPTTAGTGSEAQQYALISDAQTHVKMACGDPKACFKVAVLDPRLTVSLPRDVTAIVGFDAMSHAVESFVTTKRTTASDLFARRAWQLLSTNYRRVLDAPDDVDARGAMLLGSHLAGIAIEQSMLGATHACANPLTAKFDTTHGIAIGVMLPHVVRWNGAVVEDRYSDLVSAVSPHVVPPSEGDSSSAAERLALCLERLRSMGRMPGTLTDLGVTPHVVPDLASMAATQWTGTFNPRPFDTMAAEALYRRAGGW